MPRQTFFEAVSSSLRFIHRAARMRRGELSPTAAAGRGLLRSDLGLPPHDMKASASLPALIPNGVHKNATIGTIAVPKNSLKFKIPGEGRRSRPGGVKHKNKSGKVSQATLNHALHRIESEEAMLMARLTSLGKPNAKLVATAGPPAAAPTASGSLARPHAC